ncbi:hypothetical protein GCM10010211_82060 [Streptomyces albospinus]|uniref:Uncharacterized protein n=2 Tax=Streptomyces albospinus TaxID=285515 RepID=A0ABQ2VNH8_9ACTN|nr:hypothetical protein GCM10010211_82060 [Streptomyces albospinus]
MCLAFEVMEIFRADGRRLVVYQAPPGIPDHDALFRVTSSCLGGMDHDPSLHDCTSVQRVHAQWR